MEIFNNPHDKKKSLVINANQGLPVFGSYIQFQGKQVAVSYIYLPFIHTIHGSQPVIDMKTLPVPFLASELESK